MTPQRAPRSLLRLRLPLSVARWTGATEGVAIVEFALVLPVMLMLLLGMTEVTLAITTNRKLTLLSRSLADLTSRSVTVNGTTTTQSSIDPAGISNVFAAAGAILQPAPGASPKMVVSSIKVTLAPDGITYLGNVAWSCASGAGAVPKPSNQTYPVPEGFRSSGSTVYYVLAETVLPYQPTFGYALTGTLNLNEATPWPVRNGTKVKFVGTCPSDCACPENAT